MTRLLLVRHGETVDNVNKIMQGQTHGRLTLNGIEQAHELGRQLRGEHIDVFLSSDLARAVETLEIIKKETHPQTPPIREGSEMPLGGSSSQSEKVSTPLPNGRGRGVGLLPSERGEEVGRLLRERDWGSFTGRYIPDLQNEVWPDDIEPLDAMKARARRFLDFVRDNYPGKTVLAVGHGIINKAIQSVYLGKPMNEIQKMANCEVRVLEL
jgi:probable phosphoglycerate mutase